MTRRRRREGRERTIEDAVLLRVLSCEVLGEEHCRGCFRAGEVLGTAKESLTGVGGDVCK